MEWWGNSHQFATPAGPSDPFFSSVSVLLHGEGANGSTTIIDSSSSPKTITANGNAQISTTRSRFGVGSITFGNGGYIISSGSAFQFGTANLTIQVSIYFNAISGQAIYDTLPINGNGNRTNGFVWYLQNTGKLNLFSNGQNRGASVATIVTGQWYDLALVRSSGSWSYWINGVLDTSFTYSVNLTDITMLLGMLGDSPNFYINGNVDELRVTKGVARSIAPLTAPFPDL